MSENNLFDANKFRGIVWMLSLPSCSCILMLVYSYENMFPLLFPSSELIIS